MARHSLLTIEEAASSLRHGRVIAYPTEAVFGLGCDPENREAVNRVLALKSRPESMGLLLIASSIEQLTDWIAEPVGEVRDRLAASWPGPVTWLLPTGKRAPAWITGAHDTLAVRVSAHPPCQRLCEVFGGPVVSTSANPTSARPARSAGEVEEYFGPFIAGIMEGSLGSRLNPSEIRDAVTGKLVREG